MKATSARVLVAACLSLAALVGISMQRPITIGAEPSGNAQVYLQDAQQGGLALKNVTSVSFGPKGLLLVGDSGSGSVVAIDTGDTGPVRKLAKKLEKVDELLALGLGTDAKTLKIVDMAVNRASGKVYVACLRSTDNATLIAVIDADGKITSLDLNAVRYVRVKLPEGANGAKLTKITDVEFGDDRVVAAGVCSEEFGNKIYSLPLPMKHNHSAEMYSAETYHVAHRKWETRAPIQSFVPHVEDGKHFVVGAFSCTPIAKFPLDSLESGAKVKGTSVVELGSGNQPLDMFVYEKNGKKWLVTNTYRFHWMRNMYGPSKWWGVRVSLDYLSADKVNENAAFRDTKTKTGPNGIEIVDALAGAVQVDKLNEGEMIVLRDADGHFNLEVAELP